MPQFTIWLMEYSIFKSGWEPDSNSFESNNCAHKKGLDLSKVMNTTNSTTE